MKYILLLSLSCISFFAKGQQANKKNTIADSVANVKVFFMVDDAGEKNRIRIVSVACACDSATKVQVVADAYQYVVDMEVPDAIKNGHSATGYTLPLKIRYNK